MKPKVLGCSIHLKLGDLREKGVYIRELAGTMADIKQYDVFILSKNINPNITRGMRGVILEIWSANDFEVEFVKDDGSNYGFEGNYTFTIDKSFIEKLIGK